MAESGLPSFAEVSAVVPDGPAVDGRSAFTAQLHPGWTIGGKPNGGYLLGVLARAAGAVGAHPHVLTASAQYLRAPEPGPAQLTAEVMRAGRSAEQVRATMSQDGVACVEAMFTAGALDPGAEPFWAAGVPTHPDTVRADAVRIPSTNPQGLPVAIMDHVDLRIDKASMGFAKGRPSGRGELWGWLALPDDEPFDPVSLVYAVDALPPATFEVEVTGWVPTFQLTAYVRALPAPGPLRVLQRAHLIDGQRVDEACWIWDSRGRVVAHGVQLAGIRLG